MLNAVVPGIAFFTADTNGSPTIKPNSPGSPVPRAIRLRSDEGKSPFRNTGCVPTTISSGEHALLLACGRAWTSVVAANIRNEITRSMMNENKG